ncbi:B3/4 domain-containing protein [Tepidibacter hydrothermalis]|uniref:Phenylalanine--tRNA ligase beta subunit-related protein n=1 Tax=Tepidibacter hydrothermalis TaxID=3036126 RepID=A0ABY8EB72_9FIRM|nr:phenylalanine--tRNA ligase beta subunit-related protein [Tepidibacter hydrothermalis]WFD10166.1 phenylalanine--tRNA ligase beta subunit-related protein [Tepidibacter hydrothermalis]
MKFKVHKDVFDKIHDACFGGVVAYDVDNRGENCDIEKILRNEMDNLKIRLNGYNIKEYESIIPYRNAFKDLGINPNKYMSSIEAMAKRVSKGSKLPFINPVVNLVNSLSLKYILPMGAHDMDDLKDEIVIRFSKEGDTFIPLGSNEVEDVEAGELVYSDRDRIRTRRWIWRQSAKGSITEDSKNIFFPIDGFESKNKVKVIKAMNELEELLVKYFDCETKKFFVDKDNREVEIY